MKSEGRLKVARFPAHLYDWIKQRAEEKGLTIRGYLIEHFQYGYDRDHQGASVKRVPKRVPKSNRVPNRVPKPDEDDGVDILE